jgi:hypothetical protein
MSARLTTGRILQEARQIRGFRPFSSAEALEAGGL